MGNPSFGVSPEAVAFIVSRLRMGLGRVRRLGLVPGLAWGRNWTVMKDGRIVEHYEGEFLQVGWFDQHTAAEFTEVKLGGVKLVASADTLRQLAGKWLVVETVGVGWPTPAETTTQVMKSVEPPSTVSHSAHSYLSR